MRNENVSWNSMTMAMTMAMNVAVTFVAAAASSRNKFPRDHIYPLNFMLYLTIYRPSNIHVHVHVHIFTLMIQMISFPTHQMREGSMSSITDSSTGIAPS